MNVASLTKKGLALAIVSTAFAMSAAPAEAQWRRGNGWRGGYHAPAAAWRAPYAYGRGYRRGYNGAGIAAAAIGGIAAGALIAGTRPAYGYGYPSYGYNSYPAYSAPTYYAPAQVYSSGYADEPVCQVRRKRVWLGPNTYTFRRVTVCN